MQHGLAKGDSLFPQLNVGVEINRETPALAVYPSRESMGVGFPILIHTHVHSKPHQLQSRRVGTNSNSSLGDALPLEGTSTYIW